jgi:YVTN family beta-propeller protein
MNSLVFPFAHIALTAAITAGVALLVLVILRSRLRAFSLFIANTAAGTVEVVDGVRLHHKTTIADCPEASGILVAQDDALVFAAARGAGKILVIDPQTTTVRRSVAVGSRPNGMAWDSLHRHLLVADVQDNTARLVDPQTGQGQIRSRSPSSSPFGALGRMAWTSIRRDAGHLWRATQARWSRLIWPSVENRREYRLQAPPTRSGTITSVVASTWLSRTWAPTTRQRVSSTS